MATPDVGELVGAEDMGKLTVVAVRNAKRPGLYADGAKLYLEVRQGANGPTKSWIFRYVGTNGKQRYLGLGSLARGMTLAMAREAAAKVAGQLLAGIDPVDAKRAEKALKRGTPTPDVR